MSFWDKAKAAFGAAPLEVKVKSVMLELAKNRRAFSATDVVIRVLPGSAPEQKAAREDVLRIVAAQFDAGLLNAHDYKRLNQAETQEDLYNAFKGTLPGEPRVAKSPTFAVKARPVAQAPLPRPNTPIARALYQTTKSTPEPVPVQKPAVGTYEANPEILALSAEAMRARALRIKPYQTAWIGRVDTIPPQSDERTALIDRGLILRGYFNEAELGEIHTVGDQWLKFREIKTLARLRAEAGVEAALEKRREEQLALKAQKRAEAAERKVQRAEEIAERKRDDIIFLGRGVSKGLSDRRANVEALTAAGLPILTTPRDIANAMAIPVTTLRWLSFHAEATERTHYVTFQIPKRSGGTRLLAAPHVKLATAQRWVLDNILAKLPVESPAHGFVKGHSTVTNAAVHLGRDLVINLDLASFFPSIGFRRIRGVFKRLGYSPAVATVFALLCTESPRTAVEYDGKKVWVAVGERALPQGACTSPALSNQVTRKLDRRLRGRMAPLGWAYTRYADDLTFSAPAGKRKEIGRVQAAVRHIVEEEGFALNVKKGRVQSTAGRQTVTGIVVNSKPGIPREEVRRIRAILHGARRTGLAAQNRENRPGFERWLQGKIAYLCMVDREKGLKYLRELEVLGGRLR